MCYDTGGNSNRMFYGFNWKIKINFNMKICCFLLFIIISFTLLYFCNDAKLKRWYMFLPPLIIVPLCFIIAMLINALHIKWNHEMRELGKSIIISSFVLVIVLFAKIMVPFMLDNIISFHKTYNTSNLHRNPIKFFVDKRNYIINGFYFVFFLGSIIMLSGVYFGKK